MAKSVAIVSSLEGQAWAKAADGTLRPLKVGDTVAAEEVVVTATGAHIELDFGDGHPVAIAGGKEVTMDRDLWTDLAADNKDASIDDASVKEALTVLNNGGDLTQSLEETAAGLSGGGSNEGHDFVELTRLVEANDSQAFNYEFNGVSGSNTQQSLPGTLQENHAPILAQQSASGDEDTPISGQIQANDPENDVLTYAVTGQPANGTLVLDPVTGAFTYTPNANYNGPDSFVVTVTDDHGNTSTSTVALNVNPVNDAPVTANQNLTTAEDTPVAGQVVATDVEGDTLAYSVTTAAANGTVTINSATGAFVYTPGANFNGGDSFVVTVNDGNGGTTTSTITIGVTPVNDAPVSGNQNLTTLEDTPINGAVAASDVDGDSLSYAISGAASNGSVTLNPATGTFVYTPNANFNGSDSFVVTVSDGHGGTTTSTINIGVTPVNDAPVSANQNLTTPEDTPVAGNIVASDVEGDTLSYLVTGAASNGTVTLDPATGAFVYTPNANYNGGDSFVVTISDGNGGTTTSTITIGVTPVNDAPVSANQNLTTAEDTPVSGTVVAADLDGDTLTYAVSGNASNGSVTINPTTGAFVYTPNANYNGGDSFVVTISDGNGGTTTSTITIGVTPVNDAPVSANQNLTTPEDTPINGAVAATDVDGDALTYSVTGAASHGIVTLNTATGTFVYTPSTNFNGSDSFVVTINDGHGGITTSTINIGVTPANDVPVANNQNLTTPEGTAINGAVVATDADGDTLAYSINGAASHGSVTLNAATGAFVYTPTADFNGADSFTVRISDGHGGTIVRTVNINVTPVNDAPLAIDDTASTTENTAVTVAVRSNDTDVDGDSLTVTNVTQGANGSVVIDAVTGNPIYTPNTGFSGSDSFTYTVDDGHGGTATATVSVKVGAVNDAPVTSDQSLTTAENDPVNGAVVATDPDGDILSYSIAGAPANGSVVLNSATGTFTYTPDSNYNGSDSFSVIVSDGNGGTATSVIKIGVTPVNDAPTAMDDTATTDESTAVTIAVRGNDVDPDGDALTVTGVTQGANGSVVIDAVTGNPIYTPNAGYTGNDSFTYTIDDGNGATSTAVVTVTVNAVTPPNNLPVAVADSITVNEGGAATTLDGGATSVLTNDTDADGDPLVAVLVTGPTHGSLTLNANGTFNYTHDGSETTADSFTYKVNDGTADGNTVTVNINVTPVNENPVANDDFLTTNEDTPLTISFATLTANDTDPDGDTVIVFSAGSVSHGSLGLVGGNLVFTPEANYSGPASFTYGVHDGNGHTDYATVHINVVAVDDASVLTADVNSGDEDSGAVTGNVLSNDSDVDTTLSVLGFTVNSVTYSAGDIVSIPTVGSIQVNADGSYSFSPAHDYNGAVPQVTYTTNTGASSTLDITINPTNDAPVANDDTLSTNHDTPVVINLPGLVVNDTDVDGDALAVFSATSVNHGTLGYVGGNLTFTPDAGFVGVASFTYGVHDGHGGTDFATVYINVLNAAPVSSDQNLFTAEDTPLNGNVVASDANGDSLNYSVSTNAANGSVTLDSSTGAFVYTPGSNYNGSDSFTVTISDGFGGVTTSTITIGVTPSNDAPVAVADSILVDEGGSVSILVGGNTSLLDNDSDADGDALAAILVAGPAHGTLTLNADGTFNYVHDGSNTTSDSFSYKVNDGTVDGNTVVVNINITPVNSAPVAVADSVTVAEGGTVVSNVLTNDTDADGDTLTAVLVTGPSHGTLTLNANGSYSYTHDGSETASDSFTYKVNDGSVDGNTVTVNIGVTPVNDAPVTVADSITVLEGGTATVLVSGATSVLANDSDAENDALNAVLVTGPAHGTLTLNADGTFSYTHDGSETTTDSFTYRANDGTANGNIVTVNIGVTPVNDAPVAVAEGISVAEGGTATVLVSGATSVLTNDSDAEGDTLNAILVTGPAHGTLTLNANGTFSYTHDGSATTTDSFTYKVNDGTVDGNTVTVNIGVTPVNHAPVAVAESISVGEGGTVTVLVGGATSVLANDTDADGNALTAILVSGPANGTLTLNTDGTFSYTHNGSETTTDSFTYKVNDGTVDGNTVTVNIGVTPVNDAPVTVADSITVAEGGTATVLVSGATSVLANDSDAENDTLSAVLVSGPAHGTLTLNANGTFSYTHDGSETTTDSFTYRASDGTANGNIVTVNIGVTPVNDAPVAVADSISVLEGGTATVLVSGATSVLANDTDPENNTLNAILVTGPAHGTLTLNANGTFSYTHDGSETTTDSFTYKVNDGTVDGNTVTVNIGVTPVNDAPITVADSITVLEGGTATVLVSGATSVLANDSDAEGNTLSAVLVMGPAHGTLTLNANGTFSYTHDGSETTTDSFTYRANDGTANGNIVTVNIGVTPVNDAPVTVADSISVLEGGTVTVLVSGANSVLANDTDAENNTLSAVLVTGPAHGTLTLNANGTFSYTHDGSETTTDSFIYRANDGTANGNIVTVNIGVTPVNDAPVTVADSISVLEGGTATVLVSGATSVLANDTDAENNTLNAVLVTGPAHGTLTLNANGTFSYVHDGSETTTDSFTYRANDGTANGNIVTVNIGVTPVNDAPVTVADSISVLEGGTATVLVSGAASVLANDTDAENNTLNAVLVTGPAHGTLTLNANGTFSYTHDGSETTTDSFTYRANDGTANGNIVTVNIGVTPVNDVPVAVDDPASAAYSVQLGDAAANDLWTNVDSKGLTVAINAYKNNGATTNLYTGTVDGNANVLGVGTGASANANNTPRTNASNTPTSDVPNQIEYDVKTGKSEALEIKLNGNVSSATFGVSRLYPGESGGEVGLWQAFYKGTLVTSSTFRLGGSSNAGSFTINTGTLVFDSVKFLALGTNDGTGDGADYFVTSFSATGPASANTNYTVAEGDTLSINSASSYKLLSNDTDADGDTLSVSQINGAAVADGQSVSLASGATLLIHSNGSFDYSTGSAFNSLAAGQKTTDSFTYTVSDGHGGTATATATLTVIGKGLTGTTGGDTLVGGSYSETIMGLAGSDNLTGGAGADTFKWSLNDQGSAGSPVTDTITDFNTAQGDVLNLKDLLQNEGASNMTNYLHFASDGANTTISISSTGAFNGSNYGTAADQTIVLNNVNLTGTDTDIINQLKNNGNLITD